MTSKVLGAEGLLKAVSRLTARFPAVPPFGRAAVLAGRTLSPYARAPIVKNVYGARMELDPREYVDRALIFTPQWWDRNELAFLSDNMRPGDHFVDVGANIGAYSFWAASKVGPTGRVTAIEANPNTAAVLSRNIEMNDYDYITSLSCGVSDAIEELDLMLNTSGNRGADSFFQQADQGVNTSVRVTCRPLNDLLEAPADVLKLDIEGYEGRVLHSYLNEVEERPRALLVENIEARRERDAIRICLEAGYTVAGEWGLNTGLVVQQH